MKDDHQRLADIEVPPHRVTPLWRDAANTGTIAAT
jgi:hypothetical protein